MRSTTKTLFPVFSFALVMSGCDGVADTSITDCVAEIAGVRPTTPLSDEPWVALRFYGKTCSADPAALKGMRVSLYDTKPELIYRGDAQFVGFGAQEDGLCAVYKWPAWAGAVTSWGLLVSPRPPSSEKELALRATWLTSDQIEGYLPGGRLPAWRVLGEWALFLGDATAVPGCTPPA